MAKYKISAESVKPQAHLIHYSSAFPEKKNGGHPAHECPQTECLVETIEPTCEQGLACEQLNCQKAKRTRQNQDADDVEVESAYMYLLPKRRQKRDHQNRSDCILP